MFVAGVGWGTRKRVFVVFVAGVGWGIGKRVAFVVLAASVGNVVGNAVAGRTRGAGRRWAGRRKDSLDARAKPKTLRTLADIYHRFT